MRTLTRVTMTILSLVLMSCSSPSSSGNLAGGGGGGGGEPTRDEAFVEEALSRIRDRAIVSCDDVVILSDPIVNKGQKNVTQAFFVAVAYECLEVEIDHQETRTYTVLLEWLRLPGECFDDFQLQAIVQNVSPCVPNR